MRRPPPPLDHRACRRTLSKTPQAAAGCRWCQPPAGRPPSRDLPPGASARWCPKDRQPPGVLRVL